MEHIETRTQLIDFICENTSQRAIIRACHTGTVRVLGGFSHVLPSQRPGWIVAVTTIFERTWLVAVTTDDHNHTFKVWIVATIPWQYYIGLADQGEYSIYDGDNPEQACFAREFVNDRIKKSL